MRRVDRSLTLRSVYVKRHFQLAASLYVQKTPKGAVWFNSTIIYNWARGKFFDQFQMPENLQGYSRDHSGRRIDILYDSENGYFCLYAEHPDETVAGRMWIIEAEITIVNDVPRLAVRQSYTSSVGIEVEEPFFTIPRFIIDISQKNGLLDVKRLISKPHKVDTKDEVNDLIEFIQDENRNMPIIVVTERKDDSEYSSYLAGYNVDTSALARKVGLLAHIYELDFNLSNYFCERIGRQWGVYNGAVRTYYAGVDFSSKDSFSHPYTTANSIMSSYIVDNDGTELLSREAFLRILEDRIKQQSVKERIDWDSLGHMFFFKANKERLLQRQKQMANADVAEMAKLYEEEIKYLKRTVAAKDNDILEWMQAYEELEEELKEKNRQVFYLKSRNDVLNERSGSETEDIEIPDNYDEMPDWINKYFSGRLLLLSRAESSLKDASYEDVSLVYRSLMLLGTTYYKMRTSDEVNRNDFEDECNKIGVEESASITDNRAGEQGDTYFVKYHGDRQKMDRHIKKGDDRDPRRCMRIYFFWDDKESMVVICSLPQHLQIRTS